MSTNKLNGLILAGGQSRRMGRDKAMISYHGVPQYAYLAGLLEGLEIEAYLSLCKKQQEAWQIDMPLILDQEDNKGPLMGLYSAYQAHPQASWLVVACDFAFLQKESLSWLINHQSSSCEITAYISPFDEKAEPLLAIWAPNALSKIDKALKQGAYSAREFMATCEVELIKSPHPEQLRNVNRMEDF